MEFPYFPLYVNRFLSGTMEMSGAEVGGYMLLLLRQWDKGGLLDDDKELAKIARVKPAVLKTIKLKFEKNEDQLLRNRILEEVREEVRRLYDKNRKNGEKGGRPAKATKAEKPTANPIETQTKPMGYDWVTHGVPSGGEIQIKTKIETNTSVLGAPEIAEDRPEHAPTWQQVQEAFYQLGKPESEALTFFNHYEAFGWEVKGSKIRNVKPLANKWVSNDISQAKQEKQGAGRTVIMEHNGGEVQWTEERLAEYRANPNASGYTFIRYEL